MPTPTRKRSSIPLALTQAQLLTKLVAENADLQAKISGLLNSEAANENRETPAGQ